MKVVVYGAGAVGSVLGGLLALHKHDVCLVCREPHADAVNQSGLHVRSATGDYSSEPEAGTSLSAGGIDGIDCVLLTVKSHHTKDCAEALDGEIPADTPVVSFQNGMKNEEILGERFENVYSGICRMTCQSLQPGHASFRGKGRLVLGKYPKGSDAFARALGKVFNEAGFDACVSKNVIADKWLKLAVNTQSVFNAVIDERDHDANEFNELKARILEETQKVLKAAKVRPRSCDGRDNSIDEMIADLRRPRMPRPDHAMKVHNSAWQDLYLKRESIENPRFHELIIEMAREHDLEVPCNDVALETILRCHRNAAGPGTERLSDVLDAVEKKSGG